jgi:hypothetical protein
VSIAILLRKMIPYIAASTGSNSVQPDSRGQKTDTSPGPSATTTRPFASSTSTEGEGEGRRGGGAGFMLIKRLFRKEEFKICAAMMTSMVLVLVNIISDMIQYSFAMSADQSLVSTSYSNATDAQQRFLWHLHESQNERLLSWNPLLYGVASMCQCFPDP